MHSYRALWLFFLGLFAGFTIFAAAGQAERGQAGDETLEHFAHLQAREHAGRDQAGVGAPPLLGIADQALDVAIVPAPGTLEHEVAERT